MTCDKCGKEMTPTVLMVSTVYDCVDCQSAPTPPVSSGSLCYEDAVEGALRISQQGSRLSKAEKV